MKLPSFLPILIATGFLNSSKAGASSVDSTALGEALDYIGNWTYTEPAPSFVGWQGPPVGNNPSVVHTGTSYIFLGEVTANVELVVVGPGVARVWIRPYGSYRGSTQRAQLAVVGGEAAVISVTGLFSDRIPRPWQLATVYVPAGPQTLRLQTLEPSGGYWPQAAFDGFSFVPVGLNVTIVSSLEAQTGVPFSVAAVASAPATFSATGLPDGLSIDPATGVISGAPTAAGVTAFTITATGTSHSDTRQVTLTVAPPLGIGADQPGWTWRTAASTSQAWRFASNGGLPPKTNDGVDAIESLNFTAEDSWVETDVTGPGWITWNQWAETGQYGAGSMISVVVDGVPVGQPMQPPHEFWGERRVWIPEKIHTVRWTARLKPADSFGPGSAKGPARIDQVRFTPDTSAAPAPGALRFADWAASLPEGSRGFNQDGDGNGVSNWAEYSFGPPAGLAPWPPAAATATDGSWDVFTASHNPAAADGVWSFELLHPAIPGYAAGWSAASVWDRTFTRQGTQLEARISRIARQAQGGSPPGASYPAEFAPRGLIGRFSYRAASAGQ